MNFVKKDISLIIYSKKFCRFSLWFCRVFFLLIRKVLYIDWPNFFYLLVFCCRLLLFGSLKSWKSLFLCRFSSWLQTQSLYNVHYSIICMAISKNDSLNGPNGNILQHLIAPKENWDANTMKVTLKWKPIL